MNAARKRPSARDAEASGYPRRRTHGAGHCDDERTPIREPSAGNFGRKITRYSAHPGAIADDPSDRTFQFRGCLDHFDKIERGKLRASERHHGRAGTGRWQPPPPIRCDLAGLLLPFELPTRSPDAESNQGVLALVASAVPNIAFGRLFVQPKKSLTKAAITAPGRTQGPLSTPLWSFIPNSTERLNANLRYAKSRFALERLWRAKNVPKPNSQNYLAQTMICGCSSMVEQQPSKQWRTYPDVSPTVS
jgi:hypothetical protein